MEFQVNIALAPFTTFKIGGNARWFFDAKNKEDVCKAVKKAEEMGIKYFILGGGSNILVSDSGFDGLVIRYYVRDLQDSVIQLEDDLISVDAGVVLGNIVNYSVQSGLSGLEWAAGIPGNIGGAVRGNAGAYGGDMSQIIEEIEALGGGKIRILNKLEMEFGYRDSMCKRKGYAVLSVKIRLKKIGREEAQENIKNILIKRNKSLGKQYPSAGCVFKNPIIDDKKLLEMFKNDRGVDSKDGKIPAGYLIEKAGLKGKKNGGTLVSNHNANFILNDSGDAKAKDVIDLINFVKEEVWKKFGVKLEEEIVEVGL